MRRSAFAFGGIEGDGSHAGLESGLILRVWMRSSCDVRRGGCTGEVDQVG